MNKLNLHLIVYIFLCACSPIETNKFERTYQSIIEIAPNQKILVSLEYVGKEPFKGKWNNTHDYVNEDTDFYNMTIKNLSDFDLRLLSVFIHSKKIP